MAETPLLELREVSKHFGAVIALHEVDFKVDARPRDRARRRQRRRQVHAHQVRGGHLPASTGARSSSTGSPCTIHHPREASDLGIEVVYQDLALADNLDVVQNMFLGREELESFRLLDETKMEARARETLSSLSVTTIRSVRQTVAGLSGGQRQSVAVAKAVMWNSRLVILDEPTAALGVAQTRQVLDLVKRLADQGLGVILISHNLHDIFEVADDIMVLRLGQNVAEFQRRDTNEEEVVHAITAGKLSKVPGMAADEEVVA